MYSIEEFASGIQLYGQVEKGGDFPSVRFTLNSLYSYLHGYYSGAFGVLPLMKAVGRQDLVDKAIGILNTPVGQGAFRDHLAKYRNEMYAHAKYTFKHHEAAFADLADLSAVKTLFEELSMTTVRFLRYLRESYPRAGEAIAKGSKQPPADNPPPADVH